MNPDPRGGGLMQRHVRPEEIANVAVFLTSPGASFINGTDILVDGGMVGVSYSPIGT